MNFENHGQFWFSVLCIVLHGAKKDRRKPQLTVGKHNLSCWHFHPNDRSSPRFQEGLNKSPLECLPAKLHHYGVRGFLLVWIRNIGKGTVLSNMATTTPIYKAPVHNPNPNLRNAPNEESSDRNSPGLIWLSR